MSKTIMGIQLEKRMENAMKFQEISSRYGCSIVTRLGLHMATKEACSPNGLILLEFIEDSEEDIAKFEEELRELPEIQIQKMTFQ